MIANAHTGRRDGRPGKSNPRSHCRNRLTRGGWSHTHWTTSRHWKGTKIANLLSHYALSCITRTNIEQQKNDSLIFFMAIAMSLPLFSASSVRIDTVPPCGIACLIVNCFILIPMILRRCQQESSGRTNSNRIQSEQQQSKGYTRYDGMCSHSTKILAHEKRII